MNCTSTNISFKSGLTPKILSLENKINPRETANYFRNLKTKDAGAFRQTDFKDNRAVALVSKLCSKIFSNFRQKNDYVKGYSALNLVLPQDIYVFNQEDGDYKENQCFFVNKLEIQPEKKLPPFSIGTVFVDNYFDSLEYINELVEDCYNAGQCSTPHFLRPFVHEWLHAIFDKLVYDYSRTHSKSYVETLYNLQEKQFDDREKEIICDVVGEYPAVVSRNAYNELFAEAWAKFICDSLALDCVSFKQNPLKMMKSTPKEFQKILQKASTIDFIS